MGSKAGTVDELIKKFRTFYRQAHRQLFFMVMCHVWLEFQFVYDGVRRVKRSQNGHFHDEVFSYFLKHTVGISHKPVTLSRYFPVVTSYIKDFFPDFLSHDPFTEPEYYAYPYKHVTLDHMMFVGACHNRLEMLQYAEERELSFMDFANWATNAALSYNQDVGREVYVMASRETFFPYILNKETGRHRIKRKKHKKHGKKT